MTTAGQLLLFGVASVNELLAKLTETPGRALDLTAKSTKNAVEWPDMPRRRSTDPTTAISITMTRSLLDDIDDCLTRSQSRSAWIADACQTKLGQYPAGDIDTRKLMAMLHARVDDIVLKTLLLDRLTGTESK